MNCLQECIRVGVGKNVQALEDNGGSGKECSNAHSDVGLILVYAPFCFLSHSGVVRATKRFLYSCKKEMQAFSMMPRG